MSEIPLPSALSIVMSLYGYFLPIMLYAVWSALAFSDLGRRQIARGVGLGWVTVILLVPFFGALAYHLVGGSTVPKSLRNLPTCKSVRRSHTRRDSPHPPRSPLLSKPS